MANGPIGREVGAEPSPGGRGWTIPKCTNENRPRTLPMKVGSGPCGDRIVSPVHRRRALLARDLSDRIAG